MGVSLNAEHVKVWVWVLMDDSGDPGCVGVAVSVGVIVPKLDSPIAGVVVCLGVGLAKTIHTYGHQCCAHTASFKNGTVNNDRK